MARSKRREQTGRTVLEKRRAKKAKRAAAVKQRKRAEFVSSAS